MSRDRFAEFRLRLLAEGISRRVADRLSAELAEHHEDLVAANRLRGLSQEEAAALADEELGSLPGIAAAAAGLPALKRWNYRHASVARVSVLCGQAGRQFARGAGVLLQEDLARWLAGVLVGGLVTAGLLLSMQLAILFG